MSEPLSSKTLVQRLRDWKGNSFGPYKSPVPDLLEAADLIEQWEVLSLVAICKERDEARAEIERLRAVLVDMAAEILVVRELLEQVHVDGLRRRSVR